MKVLWKFAGSRKAWVFAGTVLWWVVAELGLEMDPATVYGIVAFAASYILGQGLADSSRTEIRQVQGEELSETDRAFLGSAAELRGKGGDPHQVLKLAMHYLLTDPASGGAYPAPAAKPDPAPPVGGAVEPGVHRAGTAGVALLVCLLAPSVALGVSGDENRHCAGTPEWDAVYQDLDVGTGNRLIAAFDWLSDRGCRWEVLTDADGDGYSDGYGAVVCASDPPCGRPANAPSTAPAPEWAAWPEEPAPEEPAQPPPEDPAMFSSAPTTLQLPDWLREALERDVLVDRPADVVPESEEGICGCTPSVIPIGGTATCTYRGPHDPMFVIAEGGTSAVDPYAPRVVVADAITAPYQGARSLSVVGRAPGTIAINWLPTERCGDVVVAEPPPPAEPPPGPSFWTTPNGAVALGVIGTAVASLFHWLANRRDEPVAPVGEAF